MKSMEQMRDKLMMQQDAHMSPACIKYLAMQICVDDGLSIHRLDFQSASPVAGGNSSSKESHIHRRRLFNLMQVGGASTSPTGQHWLLRVISQWALLNIAMFLIVKLFIDQKSAQTVSLVDCTDAFGLPSPTDSHLKIRRSGIYCQFSTLNRW